MTYNNKPNYYAVIPATIRYDNRLSANAKLLYGEITALTNKTGECWAGNAYFADLYGVNKVTVSRWISSLQKAGHITVSVHKDSRNAITKRSIGITKRSTPINKNVNTPSNKNVKGNNTSRNNTSNNTPQTPQRGDVSPIDKKCQEVLAYLNKQAGRNYRKVTKELHARIKNNDLTVQQCQMIIDWKLCEWGKKPDMANSLNPTTLFRPSNYDRYREEAERWNAQGRPKNGKPQNKTSYHSQEYLQQHSH